MDPTDQKRLIVCHTLLMENIICDEIKKYLFGKCVLTREDMEDLDTVRIAPTRALEHLLTSILPDKGTTASGKTAFECFCDTLYEMGRPELVDQLKGADISNVDFHRLEQTQDDKLRIFRNCILAQSEMIRLQESELDSKTEKLQRVEKEKVELEGKDTVDLIRGDIMQDITEKTVVEFLQQRMLERNSLNDTDRSSSNRSLLDSLIPVMAQRWLGNEGAEGKKENICRIMGPDVVRYMVNKESAPSPPNSYAAKMRRMVDVIASKYGKTFGSFVRYLDKGELQGLQAFANVANEMLVCCKDNEKTTWGHIGTLYAFGGFVARYEPDDSMKLADFIGDFLGFFVHKKLGEHIETLGGWDSFLDYGQDRLP